MKKILHVGMVSLVVGVPMVGCRRQPELVPPSAYDTVRQELLNNGELRHYPAIDPTGRWLVFARNHRTAVECGLMDLRDKSVSVLTKDVPGNYQDSVAELYAWSPDGRWLAFAESAESSKSWTVKVRDMERGEIKDSGLKLNLQDLVWIGPDTFVVHYSQYLLPVAWDDSSWKADYPRRFDLGMAAGSLAQEKGDGPVPWNGIDSKTLVSTGPGRVAFGVGGNICELELNARKMRVLTGWPKGMIKWLDYSPRLGAFLFSMSAATSAESFTLMTWKRADGAGASPLALTPGSVSALKGCWLADGYSYVSDQGGQAQLVLCREGKMTNKVFAQGAVWSYGVGAEGTELAAIGSEAMEPMGLWRIDAVSAVAERVLAPNLDSPSISRENATTPEGRPLAYTIFSPARGTASNACPVLFVNPFGRTWSSFAMILPRLGMMQVVPGDWGRTAEQGGGGADSLQAKSLAKPLEQRMPWVNQPREFQTVLNDVKRTHLIDPRRVYLEGASRVTRSIQGLIEANPGTFRGIILNSPVEGGFPDLALVKRERLEVLITIGTEDVAFAKAKAYVRDAREQGIQAWLVPIPGMGHSPQSNEHAERTVRAVVSFMHHSAPTIRNKKP